MRIWLARRGDTMALTLMAAGIMLVVATSAFSLPPAPARTTLVVGFLTLATGFGVAAGRVHATGIARTLHDRSLQHRYYREHEPVRFHLVALAPVLAALLFVLLAYRSLTEPLPSV